MGIRGEIFSTKVLLQNRTYFFNVKENRMGDLYLNVVESKNQITGGFERQSIILFADDLGEFLKGFDESLRVLEKAVKEKRKTGETRSEGRSKPRENGPSPAAGKGRWKKREAAPSAAQGSTVKRGGASHQGKSEGRDDYGKSGKRVVVRKHKE
ncbi:MAG: DUF3276 family protein [Treponema sp.]|nr:DUF3276 family protein [Treponema sp.]